MPEKALFCSEEPSLKPGQCEPYSVSTANLQARNNGINDSRRRNNAENAYLLLIYYTIFGQKYTGKINKKEKFILLKLYILYFSLGLFGFRKFWI